VKASAHDAGFALDIHRESDRSVRLSVRGRVDFANVEALRRQILDRTSKLPAESRCTIDAGGIESSDAAAAALWLHLRHELEHRGHTLHMGPIDDTTRALTALIDPDRLARTPPTRHRHPHILQAVGDYVIDRLAEAGRVLQFIGRVTLTMIVSLRNPRTIRWGEVAYLIQTTGAEALPIIGLMSMLVGLVTAFSASIQLRQFGADIFIADLVGVGMTREMGPLLAAILLTGRSGSAFAAEIGTMKISDEVDALTVMGIRPLDYLVTPRIIAVMLTLPLLTLFADVCGIAGGILIAMMNLDLPPFAFLHQLQKAIDPWDVFSGVLKALVFGILIAGVGCYRGMDTRGGAIGVGRSTTASVVMGISLIVLADSIFVVLFHYLGLG
jgi:phospholipid/cholesterol/gamma-HCH transport system permease protein